MNDFPDKAALDALRGQYPPGTRVELTAPLDDPHAKLAPGDRATVTGVDGAGDLLCRWDCGSGLKLILGADAFMVLHSGSAAQASDAYLTCLAQIRERLARLQAHADVYPEEIRWGHVNHAQHAAMLLDGITALLGFWIAPPGIETPKQNDNHY